MIKELNQRERYVLAGGAVVLGLLLIIFAVVLPYGTAIERLDKSISSRQRQLEEVRQLQADYRVLKQQAGQLQRDLGRRE
ncbi:MAG: type II secretion system protein M, partial [Desulfuromonadales bacterium]|nr:type II secretion system protein M [Desulfuromonadales bacterium]